MENASHAIIMAGSVLILIVALTISITSFTSLKKQVDEIVEQEEKINLATDENGNYVNYIENVDEDCIRIVGVETILTSVRRMSRENYKIYINSSSLVSAINSASSNDIDEDTKEELITTGISQNYNGASIIESSNEIVKISISEITTGLIQVIKDTINDRKFKEYLGIYQETSNGALEGDIETYRIITYVES